MKFIFLALLIVFVAGLSSGIPVENERELEINLVGEKTLDVEINPDVASVIPQPRVFCPDDPLRCPWKCDQNCRLKGFNGGYCVSCLECRCRKWF